ncbi:MAG: ribosomal protein S18-alanine N-acetyltransferase [Endomicrobiales bacterium]|jgi:ribosomal-protein-alanine N-acetyltransferase
MTVFLPLAVEYLNDVVAIEGKSFPTPWTRTLFEREISVPISHFFVVINDDMLVGYGGYWLVSDEASIVNLAVHPAYRKQGFGRKILLFLMDDAQTRGARAVFLEVRKGNVAAQCLYTSCGFEINGLRARYYGDEDAVVMKKILNNTGDMRKGI